MTMAIDFQTLTFEYRRSSDQNGEAPLHPVVVIGAGPVGLATAIDLAGRDILDAVQTSVNPKVIDVPNTSFGQPTIDGVSAASSQVRTPPAASHWPSD